VSFRIGFSPEARADLFNLYIYIAEQGFPERAIKYIARIEKFCQGLQTFPHRGQTLDHLRPGLRMVSFERRVAITFEIVAEEVVIFRILYGGRDVDRLLSPDE
jgi:toxin ParE1/3/4